MTKEERYTAAIREIEVRMVRGGYLVGDLGNVAAILKKRLDFFWIGFYFFHENHLVLGPFQGTPACVFLSIEKGVCAECAKRKETVLVPDVSAFPGHVACDPNSKSEIAVPVFDTAGNLRAVLDADSDVLNTFDEVDRTYLEKVAEMIRACWEEDEVET